MLPEHLRAVLAVLERVKYLRLKQASHLSEQWSQTMMLLRWRVLLTVPEMQESFLLRQIGCLSEPLLLRLTLEMVLE